MKKLSFLLFYVSSIFCFVLHGQTPIPGGEVSGTWSIDGSPYLIQNSITVPNDSTLLIEPGVVVEFQGSYTMYINGCVLAQGTETDSILFTAADTTVGFNSIRYLETTVNNDTSKYEYCIFTYGRAHGPYPDNFGGALAAIDFGKIIVDHCRFAYNKAVWENIVKPGGGAAIAVLRSNMVIRNCLFEYNRGCIGGVLMLSTDTTLVENNVFRNNRAPLLPDYRAGHGGAICCKWKSYAVIRGNKFYWNHADRGYGAIMLYSNGNARIENNLFYGNSADLYGGAIGIDSSSSPVLINNNIVDNSAVSGGGIDVSRDSDPIIYNTILWGNTASEGSQLYISSADCSPNFYYSDIQGGQNAFGGHPLTGFYLWCLDEDPLFSGGANEPYALSDISPCIDHGTTDTTGLCINSCDIIGKIRIWDGNGDGDTIIDIGAYEFGSTGVGIAGKEPFAITKNVNLYIYPNPAYKEINILSDDQLLEEVIILSLSGKKVVCHKPGKKRIDISTLPTGMYIVEVTVENMKIRKKLLVE